MIFNTVSIDSSKPEQCIAVRIEMEATLGCDSDPLDILIALEDELGPFDISSLGYYLNR